MRIGILRSRRCTGNPGPNTGCLDENRYCDVEVVYAKAAADDLLIRIAISNRGPEPATIDVLPTLWFRNTWSWGRDSRRPCITARASTLVAKHRELGDYVLYSDGADELLFTENETNTARLYGVAPSIAYVKDAFHEYVVRGNCAAVNPDRIGTKAAARYRRMLKDGETIT